MRAALEKDLSDTGMWAGQGQKDQRSGKWLMIWAEPVRMRGK